MMNPLKPVWEACRFIDRKTSYVDKAENWPKIVTAGAVVVAACTIADKISENRSSTPDIGDSLNLEEHSGRQESE